MRHRWKWESEMIATCEKCGARLEKIKRADDPGYYLCYRDPDGIPTYPRKGITIPKCDGRLK
jgi:hypothetical protein